MSARTARATTAVIAAGVALSWAALLAATPSAVAAAPSPDPPAPGPASEPIAIGPGPAGSTAAGQLTWGVGPAHADSTPARTAFTYAVEPGWRIPDAVRITNFTNTALSLQVYAQDGLTTHDGGFDLLSGDQAASDLGTWVRIHARSVTVPARSRIDVPFLIEVPADARPGDHAGGIVAAIVDQRRSINDQVVRFEQRVGARLYLRLPGEITAGLAVEDLRVTYETSMNPLNPGLARLTYTVRNVGNVRLGAQPTARVRDLAGLHSREATGAPVNQILPGQVVTVVQDLPGVWPLLRLRAEAGAQPLPPPEAAAAAAAATQPASHDFWAVPWPVLALVVAVTAAVVLRRRRRSRVEGPPGAAEPDLVSPTPEGAPR